MIYTKASSILWKYWKANNLNNENNLDKDWPGFAFLFLVETNPTKNF